MYEALYAPIPDVNAYLDRLGLTAPLPVSLETISSWQGGLAKDSFSGPVPVLWQGLSLSLSTFLKSG